MLINVTHFLICANVQRCLPCLYNKSATGVMSEPMQLIQKIPEPFDTLHIDHLGPFVTSTQKNTHLIVVVDAFPKFVFLWPVPNTKVMHIAKFLDRIISAYGVPQRYGVPWRFIGDRGPVFTSQSFSEYCKMLGIKVILTATATPRGNGQVERVNVVVLNQLITVKKITGTDMWSKFDSLSIIPPTKVLGIHHTSY